MIQHASPTVRPTVTAPAQRQAPALTLAAAPPAPLPEIAVPHLMGLRTGANRPHRHKVPLRRLTAVTC
ncbi:hypothetical protein [Streptomyces sp. NPDC049915]|uniref:hypothetical protein n=1 Tax=Streptomyces sp. NPDC049915 TaxID=3155510 RepID=UPI00341FBDA4